MKGRCEGQAPNRNGAALVTVKPKVPTGGKRHSTPIDKPIRFVDVKFSPFLDRWVRLPINRTSQSYGKKFKLHEKNYVKSSGLWGR